jgi:hypothetical protein
MMARITIHHMSDPRLARALLTHSRLLVQGLFEEHGPNGAELLEALAEFEDLHRAAVATLGGDGGLDTLAGLLGMVPFRPAPAGDRPRGAVVPFGVVEGGKAREVLKDQDEARAVWDYTAGRCTWDPATRLLETPQGRHSQVADVWALVKPYQWKDGGGG